MEALLLGPIAHSPTALSTVIHTDTPVYERRFHGLPETPFGLEEVAARIEAIYVILRDEVPDASRTGNASEGRKESSCGLEETTARTEAIYVTL